MKTLRESLLDIDDAEKSITGTELDAVSRIEIGCGYGTGDHTEMLHAFNEIFDWDAIEREASKIKKKNLDKITIRKNMSSPTMRQSIMFLTNSYLEHPERVVNLAAVLTNNLPIFTLVVPEHPQSGECWEISQNLRKPLMAKLRKFISKNHKTKITRLTIELDPIGSLKLNTGGCDQYLCLGLDTDIPADSVMGNRTRTMRHVQLMLDFCFFH